MSFNRVKHFFFFFSKTKLFLATNMILWSVCVFKVRKHIFDRYRHALWFSTRIICIAIITYIIQNFWLDTVNSECVHTDISIQSKLIRSVRSWMQNNLELLYCVGFIHRFGATRYFRFYPKAENSAYEFRNIDTHNCGIFNIFLDKITNSCCAENDFACILG